MQATTNTVFTTVFQLWNDGKIGNFGSFQTTIFQAYRLADNGNRERLQMAFPDWFTPANLTPPTSWR